MNGGVTRLTEGKVWRQLVRYATPLVLSSVLQATYSMVDMMIVGHYVGSAGLSALNNSTQITGMLTKIIIGICTGGNILIGQYFGAGDDRNVRDTTVTLFSMGLILGVVLSVAFFWLSGPLLVLLRAPAFDEAAGYLRICSLGLFFVVGYNALTAVLTAVGNSRQPMYFILITSVVNMILDVVLVGALKWGTTGAAIATVMAQGVSFLACLIFVLRHSETFGLRLNRLFMHMDKLRRIWRLGLPCAVQMSVASISWLAVTYQINFYGVFVSAGNGVSIKIKDFFQLFIHAMSNGAAAMIAQNLGAGQQERAKETMYTAMKICVGISLLFIVIVEVFAPQLVLLFTDEAETAAAAVLNLRIEIISQVFYAVFLIYHSLALGAGHTMFVFFSSFVNCIAVRLVLTFLFNHFFGLVGIYVACLISPAASIPLGMAYTRSDRWRRSLTGQES